MRNNTSITLFVVCKTENMMINHELKFCKPLENGEIVEIPEKNLDSYTMPKKILKIIFIEEKVGFSKISLEDEKNERYLGIAFFE